MMWNRIGLSYKLGPIIFQKICQMQRKGNWGMAALYIYQVRTPNAIHCLHVVGTTRSIRFKHRLRAGHGITFVLVC
jgi:hypothetical protein